jgi:hypothetical protein
MSVRFIGPPQVTSVGEQAGPGTTHAVGWAAAARRGADSTETAATLGEVQEHQDGQQAEQRASSGVVLPVGGGRTL